MPNKFDKAKSVGRVHALYVDLNSMTAKGRPLLSEELFFERFMSG